MTQNLKAALFSAGERPWGHSVSALLDQYCVAIELDTALAPRVEAEVLEEHYMRPRYPDARDEVEGEYHRATAEEAPKYTRTLLAFVRRNSPHARVDAEP